MQPLHYFPLRITKTLQLKTESREPLFAEEPQTNFLSEMKHYFSFTELLTKNSEKTCSVIVKTNTMHVATLPTGLKGYQKLSITTVKPLNYRIIDLKTPIHSVVHTYHPEITKQINGLYRKKTQTNTSNEINHFDLYNDPKLNNTVCDDQRSQNLAPRIVTPLSYVEKNTQVPKNFRFQNFDLKNTEFSRLWKFFVEKKHCYATHPKDIGKNSTPFRLD